MNAERCLPPPGRGEYYGCGELARLIGRHPNTLRRYETWGFIGPVDRGANGYRHYSRRRACEALLAVIALRTSFTDWRGRRLTLELIRAAAAGECARAEKALGQYIALLDEAGKKLAKARRILDLWRRGKPGPDRVRAGRWQAARKIGVAPDTLRDWERCGLVRPGRLGNGRRVYTGPDFDRLTVIKVLREGGYSLMGILHLFGSRNHDEDLRHARDKWEETLKGLIADTRTMKRILRELNALP